MEVTINITGLENLVAAINRLAAAGGMNGAGMVQPSAPQPYGQAPAQQAPAPQQVPIQPPAPQSYGQAPAQQAPPQQVPPQMGAVPTTAMPQEYTQDQLAVAMTGLVDRGMQPQVMGILNTMGCQTLLQVPKERYPELVLKLRKAFLEPMGDKTYKAELNKLKKQEYYSPEMDRYTDEYLV